MPPAPFPTIRTVSIMEYIMHSVHATGNLILDTASSASPSSPSASGNPGFTREISVIVPWTGVQTVHPWHQRNSECQRLNWVSEGRRWLWRMWWGVGETSAVVGNFLGWNCVLKIGGARTVECRLEHQQLPIDISKIKYAYLV